MKNQKKKKKKKSFLIPESSTVGRFITEHECESTAAWNFHFYAPITNPGMQVEKSPSLFLSGLVRSLISDPNLGKNFPTHQIFFIFLLFSHKIFFRLKVVNNFDKFSTEVVF